MKTLNLLKQYGFKCLAYRYFESKDTATRSAVYQQNIRRFLPTEEELQQQRTVHFDYAPKYSIVVPAYETKKVFLEELVDSVLAQSYPNFELIIADGSETDIVRKTLSRYDDCRIVYLKLEKNTGISGNTNEGFTHTTGEYVALLDHDDTLTPNALFEMTRLLNELSPRPDMIYSDEDKLNQATGLYTDPSFKPDYNEYFLRHVNYICHFLIYSKELLDKVGGLDATYDGAQDHEFILRCAAYGARIAHIPKILYHWRIHPDSTAGDPNSKLYAFHNGTRAIEKYLSSVGDPGKVSLTRDLGIYHIHYDLDGRLQPTKLLILGENEKHLACLRRAVSAEDCISNLEITFKISDAALSSEEVSQFDYVLWARKDAVPTSSGWLAELLSDVINHNVGVVSAKYVHDHRILCCGSMYVGSRQTSDMPAGSVIPLYSGLNENFHGYSHRAVDVTTNISLDPMYFSVMPAEVFLHLQTIRDPYQLCLTLNRDGRYVLVNSQVAARVNARDIPSQLSSEAQSLMKDYDPYYSPYIDTKKGQFLL